MPLPFSPRPFSLWFVLLYSNHPAPSSFPRIDPPGTRVSPLSFALDGLQENSLRSRSSVSFRTSTSGRVTSSPPHPPHNYFNWFFHAPPTFFCVLFPPGFVLIGCTFPRQTSSRLNRHPFGVVCFGSKTLGSVSSRRRFTPVFSVCPTEEFGSTPENKIIPVPRPLVWGMSQRSF